MPHGQPHHPAAPAAPATPQPPQWKPLNWSFPFAPKRGNAADPQTWFTALAGAGGGFYPLGSNGMFHGGIHFDAGTGSDLKQEDGVRVIADGEVVAYRLDSMYPELTYPLMCPAYALYSTSFVLVRHKLVLPPAQDTSNTSATPAAPASGASPAGTNTPQEYQPPAGDTLEFYSLYMHQLDWSGYKAAQAAGSQSPSPIHSLPFWQGDKHFRVGTKATNQQSVGDADASQTAAQKGINIRDRANGAVLGLLPKGSECSVSGNATTGWAQIASITKGAPVAATVGGTVDPRATTGWVYLNELDPVFDPKPLDAVVVLNKPARVKAGDVVGYLGEYTDSSRAQRLPPKPTYPLLHVEVFTGAQINDFIAKSKDRANKLGDRVPGGKSLLVIPIGTKFASPSDPQSNAQIAGLTLVLANGDPGKGYWAKVQPTQMPAQSLPHGHHGHPTGTAKGNPVWVQRRYAGQVATAATQTWTTFPLQPGKTSGSATGYQLVLSRTQLDQAKDADKAADDQGTKWWRISAGDSDGKTFFGWVCEKNHPDTQWQSPWAWPGFDTVDTTGVSVFDLYRRGRYEIGQLLDGEEKEFSVVAATVNAGALIGKLEKAVSRQGNVKGNVVPADLKKALTVRWLAAAISHLIVRYESEWGGDMSKWDKLTPIMGAAGIPVWKTEMERIKKLQWWDKVKAVKDFPASPDVWHVHPIGLVGNFFKSKTCDCGCSLGKVFNRSRWVRHRAHHQPETYYGPVYEGTKKLDKFTGWGDLIAKSKATEDEKAIVIAMSSNEGNMDAVQAWDWQTFSAGAMQKTVTPEGYGELPQQIFEFRNENPSLFEEIFGQCGWSIKQEGNPRIYYSSSDTENREITGQELYNFIKNEFQETDSGFPKESKPLASIAHAMINEEYQKKQVVDFIGRLRRAIAKKPSGYSKPASDFFQSRLGHALVLDHDVNAPGNVSTDLGRSIDTLRARHTGLGTDPTQWGANRSTYETELIQIYGPSRNMNSALARYNQLRGLL